MNRAARRRQERESKKKVPVARIEGGMREGRLEPVPQPLGWDMGKRTIRGVDWAQITMEDPTGTKIVLMKRDALGMFVEDALGLLEQMGGTVGEPSVEVVGDTGLVVAKEMPK